MTERFRREGSIRNGGFLESFVALKHYRTTSPTGRQHDEVMTEREAEYLRKRLGPMGWAIEDVEQ